ncbi:6,7-dimethyl-8-ribityllumazine synthase [Pirellulaceae bacterium]|jgi:6,7-dimethyl-8-ribityllumazine synthase|nr:6,7-dimethyl-8-ribityllumazine synthase [Pirellulaceae bacterium]
MKLANEFSGGLEAANEDRFAIIVSRYNSNITEKLLVGAIESLESHGVKPENMDVFRVPGAWELSIACQKAAESKKYAAVICLGAVIRGETTHDQYINQQVSLSLGNISLQFGIPVSFGLLTCNNMEQAIHRAGGNVGNKGIECAEAALEMVGLLKQI